MSWDLYLRCDHCGMKRDLGNYTHNTNAMIRAASGGKCWGDYDGQPASKVADFALKVANELVANYEKFDAMNPENGWGSRENCVRFIREVGDACRENSKLIFEASG